MKSPVRLNPASPLLFMTVVYFTFLALLPKDYAVVPPPDGGYPNFTTAEGHNALKSLTTGAGNTAVGWSSLFSITTANFNTAVGAGTLALNTAFENTATGAAALLSNSGGFQNTANGAFALLFNTSGSFNTAIGDSALYSNIDGLGNTATGVSALQNNTNGGFNTANGDGALLNNTTGSNNTAVGLGALGANTAGNDNTASGFQALFNNSADGNTATGTQALMSNSTGEGNAANGFQALFHNIDGDDNTAIGFEALFDNTGSSNIGIGHAALLNKTDGNGNIALGNFAGNNLLTGNSNIYIGNNGAVANESNTMRIGTTGTHTRAFIAGVRDVTTAGSAIPVLIDSVGQLGTMSSSRRFKNDIKPMDKASEAILALTPVTFHYKNDNTGTQQFGLIAEEVEEVNPDLVVRDKNGEIYTVRYDQVNAMLLNEFLKEHRNVQQQDRRIQEHEATIAELKREVETMIAHSKVQDAKIQRVSNQVQASNSAAQVVVNGP
jgi:trimeric autotransporter adhesin